MEKDRSGIFSRSDAFKIADAECFLLQLVRKTAFGAKQPRAS
jgi:hypothetical protein